MNNSFSTNYLSQSENRFQFRPPVPEDGAKIHKLVEQNPPLDPNSLYCNLLQCTHFADTCVVCECDGEVVAFLTGYMKPGSARVLFCWQMAVAENARGNGLAGKMVDYLATNLKPSFVESTVTESNKASSSVFVKFAEAKGATLEKSVLFDRDQHFAGEHDSELLYRIGPIQY